MHWSQQFRGNKRKRRRRRQDHEEKRDQGENKEKEAPKGDKDPPALPDEMQWGWTFL